MTERFQVLHPHEFCPFICRYPYLAVVLNFSQTWALYCLIQFYTATKEKLEPIKPLSKFLTFKSIVFLTWWQGVAVAFLFSTGLFNGHLAQRFQTRIQDYIICLEVCFYLTFFVHCHGLAYGQFWLVHFSIWCQNNKEKNFNVNLLGHPCSFFLARLQLYKLALALSW